MLCTPKGLEHCGKANFSLIVKNKHTSKALPDAVFVLQSNCCPLFSIKSGKDGVMKFPRMCPGTYTLALTRAAEGYKLCGQLPVLRITPKGNLRIDGKTRRRLIIFFEPLEK